LNEMVAHIYQSGTIPVKKKFSREDKLELLHGIRG
jgi:hypothetical protein